jgi:hypothetical protein
MELTTMSTDMDLASPGPPASSRFSLPRFPVGWAVENPKVERVFARLLWLLVPLQYYVVTNIGKGLSADDLVAAVALSLISVVVIFIVSCVMAWLASVVWPTDPWQGDTLTRRVRMWVVALMICTAGSYCLLALSLLLTHFAISFGARIYGDLMTDRLIAGLRLLGYSWEDAQDLRGPLLFIASLIYAFAAMLLVVLAQSALRRGPAGPAQAREPDVVSVCVITALVMTATNFLAVQD